MLLSHGHTPRQGHGTQIAGHPSQIDTIEDRQSQPRYE